MIHKHERNRLEISCVVKLSFLNFGLETSHEISGCEHIPYSANNLKIEYFY